MARNSEVAEKRREYMRNYVEENWDYWSQRTAAYHRRPEYLERRKIADQTPEYKIHNYKKSAKERDIPFSLSKPEFIDLFNGTCPYCGQADAHGIDRVDSNKGYNTDNCVPCCKYCNRMKNRHSVTTFVRHCNIITATAQQRTRKQSDRGPTNTKPRVVTHAFSVYRWSANAKRSCFRPLS